jgi:hypothetical protein
MTTQNPLPKDQKSNVLSLQELAEVKGGGYFGKDEFGFKWSTASGSCGTVGEDEWSTVSWGC